MQSTAPQAGKKPKSNARHILSAKRDALVSSSTAFSKSAVSVIDIILKGYEDKRDFEDIYDKGRFILKLGDTKVIQDAISDVLDWAMELEQDLVADSAQSSDTDGDESNDEDSDEDDNFDKPILQHPNAMFKTASNNFAFESEKISSNNWKGAISFLRNKHQMKADEKLDQESDAQQQQPSKPAQDISTMMAADRWKNFSPNNMCIDGDDDFVEPLKRNPFDLPDVAHKKSDEAKNFGSKTKFRALIIKCLKTFECAPRNFDNTVTLQATIAGGTRDPIFTLKADPIEAYPGTARFPTVLMKLGAIEGSRDPNYMADVVSVTKQSLSEEEVSILKAEFETERDPIVMRVVYRGIRISACSPPPQTGNPVYDNHYAEVLAAMDSLPQPVSRRDIDQQEIWLITVPFNERGDEIMTNFFDCFNAPGHGPKKEFKYNMHPYLIPNSTSAPFGHIDCRTRKDAFEDGRPPVFPQRAYAKTVAEKQAVLAQGSMIEHLFDQARANRFSKAIHSVCFVKVKEEAGKNLSFALLQADKSVLKNADVEEAEDDENAERVRIELRDYFNSTEEVSLKLEIPGLEKKRVMVKGKVTCLTGKPWDDITFFAALAVKSLPMEVRTNNLSDHKFARWESCSFDTKKSVDLLTRSLHYVRKFLEQPLSQGWLGLKKLPHERLPTLQDFLTANELEFINEAIDFAVAEFNLNSEQEKFLRGFTKASSCLGVCAGCGGSGKTVVMAIVTVIGELIDRQILLFAPTNSAVDSQYKRVKSVRDVFMKKFRDGKGLYGELSAEPVRLHVRGYESKALSTLGDTIAAQESSSPEADGRTEQYKRLAEAFDQEANIAAVEHGILLDKQKKFSNYDSSLAKQVQDLRDNGTEILVDPYSELEGDQRTYYDLEGNPFTVAKGSQPDQVDAIAFMGTYWNKKQAQEDITDIDKKMFKKFKDDVFKEVLGDVPVLISTIGNILVNDQIKRNFGRGKRGYWVLCDETTMAMEADIITAAMMVFPDERWEKESKGRCPLQFIGLFGDPRQMYARLMSEKKNEFRELLKLDPLTRSIMCAHDGNVIFTQQHRAHVDIWEGSNGLGQIIYKGIISAGHGTARTDPGRSIERRFVEFMADFMKMDPEYFLCEETGDIALALERQKIMHRFLLNIGNTTAAKSVAGSRFNGANLTTFQRFQEALLKTKLDEGGLVFDMRQMVYSTPYTAQRDKCLNRTLKLIKRWNKEHPDHEVSIKDMPACKISDHLQSEEYEFVWYDTVVDKKLGFLNDNRRVATHLTRAKNFLWTIGNPEITAAEHEKFAKSDHSGGSGRRDDEAPLLPAFFAGQAAEQLSMVIDEPDTGEDDEDIYMGIGLAPKPNDDDYTNHIYDEQFDYEKARPGISLAKYDYLGMLKEEAAAAAAAKDEKPEEGTWGDSGNSGVADGGQSGAAGKVEEWVEGGEVEEWPEGGYGSGSGAVDTTDITKW